MRRVSTVFAALIIFPVVTVGNSSASVTVENRVNNKVENRTEVRVEGEGSAEARVETRLNVNSNRTVVEKIKSVFRRESISILSGKITEVGDGFIVIEKEGKSIKVVISEGTKLRRRFWGKSSFSEFSKGDLVNVIGVWTNEQKTQIQARLIRNLTLQKRFGVVFGKVKAKTENTIVIETEKKGELSVTFSSETKMVNRKMEAITIADIHIGNRIRVKGLWDNQTKTITEVTQIKSFSVPLSSTPKPTED